MIKTVSRELAQKLREAGYPMDESELGLPSAEEILDRLPEKVKDNVLCIGRGFDGWTVDYVVPDPTRFTYVFGFAEKSLAEAAGLMYKYLAENNLLKPTTG